MEEVRGSIPRGSTPKGAGQQLSGFNVHDIREPVRPRGGRESFTPGLGERAPEGVVEVVFPVREPVSVQPKGRLDVPMTETPLNVKSIRSLVNHDRRRRVPQRVERRWLQWRPSDRWRPHPSSEVVIAEEAALDGREHPFALGRDL